MLSSVVPWSCGRDDMLQVDPSGPRRPFYLLIKLGTIDKKVTVTITTNSNILLITITIDSNY